MDTKEEIEKEYQKFLELFARLDGEQKELIDEYLRRLEMLKLKRVRDLL